jgi:hypothetical protein
MHAQEAYAALVKELESFRALSGAHLASLAGGPPTQKSVILSGEHVDIEIHVFWADAKRTKLRIHGTARGPSTWHHELVEESIAIVLPP